MKKSIFVVDDQGPVLEVAMLLLRCCDPDWEVRGFQEPLGALEAVRSQAPDLVLCDQLMPQMLGSQLLEQIREISPPTIRIIMSGHVPLNQLTLITTAHQYLAKPFDAARLRESVRRSFAAQSSAARPRAANIASHRDSRNENFLSFDIQ